MEMETKQELIGLYTYSYCQVHQHMTRFLLTEDNENHIICVENGCGFRKILTEIPKEEDIQKVSMKDFYNNLNKKQNENG